MLLLVGLGNPGPKYAGTRHNVGFLAIDAIARRYRFGNWRNKFEGETAEGTIDGERVLALKPQTYMNESGRSVGAAVRFHKFDLDEVIVLHDEIDLAPGKVRVKRGGGAAGHNGIRDIDHHIGNDFRRVRIGVGHPGDRGAVHGHVLRDFSKSDQEWLDKVIDAIADAIPLMIKGDDPGFMTRVAFLTQPPKPKEPPKAKESGPAAGGGEQG